MCLKNGFIILGTEKYENPIFIYVLIICDSPNIIIVLCPAHLKNNFSRCGINIIKVSFSN